MNKARNNALTTFYALLITQTLSLLGSRMSAAAVGVWVFQQTGSVTPLLLASFFRELPAMLANSLAGAFVDRWPRRLVLVLADAGQAVSTALLLFSFISGRFEVWHLYAVAFIQGSFEMFHYPAQAALTTQLVPAGQRARANGLREVVFPLAGSLGPVLAGALYGLVGVSGVILTDLATFGLAAIVSLLVRLPALPDVPGEAADAGDKEGLWAALRTGLRFVQVRRGIGALLLYNVFTNFMLNGPLDLSLPYLLSRTGSTAQMGQLLGVMSLGAFTGAILITIWGGARTRIHTWLPGMLLCGLMFIPYAAARSPWLLAASIFFLMLPLPIGNAMLASIIQAKTPLHMQGRVFAMLGQLAYLGSTLSFLLAGPLADGLFEPAANSAAWPGWLAAWFGSGAGAGMAVMLALTGVIIFTVTLLAYLHPAIRHIERDLPDVA